MRRVMYQVKEKLAHNVKHTTLIIKNPPIIYGKSRRVHLEKERNYDNKRNDKYDKRTERSEVSAAQRNDNKWNDNKWNDNKWNYNKQNGNKINKYIAGAFAIPAVCVVWYYTQLLRYDIRLTIKDRPRFY